MVKECIRDGINFELTAVKVDSFGFHERYKKEDSSKNWKRSIGGSFGRNPQAIGGLCLSCVS